MQRYLVCKHFREWGFTRNTMQTSAPLAVALFCLMGSSCQNKDPEPTPEAPVLLRSDSIRLGIVYTPDFIQRENTFVIENVPFGVGKRKPIRRSENS